MAVRSLSFSPDGHLLYSASDDGRVNAHDVYVAAHAEVGGCFAHCRSAALLAHLDALYNSSSSAAHSASLVHSYSGHLSWVLCVDTSPDGLQIVTGYE